MESVEIALAAGSAELDLTDAELSLHVRGAGRRDSAAVGEASQTAVGAGGVGETKGRVHESSVCWPKDWLAQVKA
jgi:hypothetical protein